MRKFQGRKANLRPGFIVNCEFSALGGVRYKRKQLGEKQLGERGLQREHHTEVEIDNVELLKESKAIIGAAYYVMDRACVNTPVGYFADEGQLSAARKGLAEVQSAASMFNEMARLLGSERRVTIDVFPFEISPANEYTARRLHKVVRERLEALRDALHGGDRKLFEASLDKARNLEKLSTGIHADAIKLALEVAKERKSELLELLSAGNGNEIAGSKLDLEPLQAAINLFADADEAHTADGEVLQ